MDENIRAATPRDVALMVDLAAERRVQYEAYQPRFWKRAADAATKHLPYLQKVIADGNAICLVHEAAGAVDGFVIAQVVGAPPVYDPGGMTCIIDDFCVRDPEAWQTTGAALIQAAGRVARARGAVQVVVVCGHLDEAKRAMLRQAGLSIASEWWVGDPAT